MLEFGVSSPIWREILIKKFEEVAWFKKSSQEIKEQLISLGEENQELAEKIIKLKNPEKNIEILSIEKVVSTENLIIINFKQRSRLTNQLFNKEVVFDKNLEANMGHGVLLISNQGKVEAVVTGNNLTSIRMKFPSFSTEKTLYLPSKLEKWLKTTLNKSEIVVSNFVDLGETETLIFAVIIEGGGETKAKITESFEFYKINEVERIIEESKDSFLISALSRLKLRKVL